MLLNKVGEKLTIVAIGSDISIESLKILGARVLLVKDIENKDELAQIYSTILDSRAVIIAVSYTHLRAHETEADLVCRLLLEKKKQLRK